MSKDVQLSVLVTAETPIIHQCLALALRSGGEICVSSSDIGKLAPTGCANPSVILVVTEPRPGLEAAIRKLCIQYPDSKVACMLLGQDDLAIAAAIRAGATGIIEDEWSKNSTTDELVTTIRKIAAGETVIPSSVAVRLVKACAKEGHGSGPRISTRDDLSNREWEVLELLAQGLTNKEIAVRLAISDHTIRSHTRGIMQKLQVTNRVQAAAVVWKTQVSSNGQDKKGPLHGHISG